MKAENLTKYRYFKTQLSLAVSKQAFLYLCLIFSVSCQEINTATSLSEKANRKLLITEQKNGKIREMRDTGPDSTTGGIFQFDSLEILRNYYFFTSQNGYSFHEQYGSNGEIIKTVGKPLLFIHVHDFREDSLSMKFDFYAIDRIYNKVHLKIDGYEEVTLAPHVSANFAFATTYKYAFRPYLGKTEVRLWIWYRFQNTLRYRRYYRNFFITRGSVIDVDFGK